MGFDAGYTRGDLDWQGRSHAGDQNGVHVGIYAQAASNGFFLNAPGSYSRFDNDAERSLSFDGYSATARSGFDSNAALGRLEGGYDLSLGGVMISPAAWLRYINLNENGINESGADILSLNGGERDTDSLVSGLGVRLASLWELGEQARLIPVSACSGPMNSMMTPRR